MGSHYITATALIFLKKCEYFHWEKCIDILIKFQKDLRCPTRTKVKSGSG